MDVTAIMATGETVDEAKEKLQNTLDKVNAWMTS